MEELQTYCESFRDVIDPNKLDSHGHSAHDYAMKSKENQGKLLEILEVHFNGDVKKENEHAVDLETQNQKEMFFRVLSFFIPTALTHFFSILIDSAMVQAFVGHRGKAHMIAGLGQGITVVNVFHIGMSIGMNQSLATYLSQFYGVGDYS